MQIERLALEKYNVKRFHKTKRKNKNQMVFSISHRYWLLASNYTNYVYG